METGKEFLIALGMIRNVRSREKIRLFDLFGHLEDFCRLRRKDLEAVLQRRLKGGWDPDRLKDDARRAFDCLGSCSAGILALVDPDYPELLKQIYDPPFALFYRGVRLSRDFTGTALVGTRTPTETARKGAEDLGASLARAGEAVVSGLALGIDAASQRGAVAAGGQVVAVLGSGVDQFTPRANRVLGMDILNTGGTVMSEYAPGTVVKRHHFPERNRIIAGLCHRTVVVQAPARSGALITADFALEQGRDVAVYGPGCRGVAGAGSRALAEDGAEVLSSSDSAELVEASGDAGKVLAEEMKLLLENAVCRGGENIE